MEMKICDECNSSPANVHLTQIVQNELVVKHLCEECAKHSGITIVIENEQIAMQDDHKNQKKDHKAEKNPDKEITCPDCRMHFSEFKENGRLGCSNCYIAFEKEIHDLLIQVHGASQHKGKEYHQIHREYGKTDDVKILRSELNNAIRNEKFELAALIRDEIQRVSVPDSTENSQD